MADNAARVLAGQGTPGPWSAHEGDLEGGTILDYLATVLGNREKDGTTTGRLFLTLGRNDIDPENGAEVVPAMTGDGPSAEANAHKIALAVNALPLLADLLDAVAEIERYLPPPLVEKDSLWADVLRARDALDAALRGEQ